MESRFSKLEFDKPQEQKKKSQHFAELCGERQHLDKAEKYAVVGDHEKALRSYAAALNDNPLSLDAWCGQVVMLIRLKEYEEAGMWADKAMEKFPQQSRLVSLKAVAYHRLGRKSEALMLNDSALKNKGEFHIVWLARGEIMMDFNPTISEECFAHAVKLPSPSPGKVYLWIGEVYILRRKYSRAMTYLQKATSKSSECAWGWYLMGLVHLELNQYDLAKQCFTESRTLYPALALYRTAEQQIPHGFLDRLLRYFRSLRNG